MEKWKVLFPSGFLIPGSLVGVGWWGGGTKPGGGAPYLDGGGPECPLELLNVLDGGALG